ncbi:ATPase [Aquisediminimonas sediminicola]|uniref:F0F1 ATP synthase subunit B family protein n=1 Tax=Alteraquisediminimonas sediminicola TaxID=2676787 RepID=UPI001C8D78AE|nr:ATPase [Aquisediminimonas sediminicola]
MPQLDQILGTYASQIFWLLVVFGTIYLLIGKGMLPKVEQTIDARDRRIAEDLAAAELARVAAADSEHGWQDALEAGRNEAVRTTQTAKDAAAKASAIRLADVDAALHAKLAEGEAAVQKALASAQADLESVGAELTGDLVARLSGATITDAKISKSVKAVMGNA